MKRASISRQPPGTESTGCAALRLGGEEVRAEVRCFGVGRPGAQRAAPQVSRLSERRHGASRTTRKPTPRLTAVGSLLLRYADRA
jgi:hypothetical protein